MILYADNDTCYQWTVLNGSFKSASMACNEVLILRRSLDSFRCISFMYMHPTWKITLPLVFIPLKNLTGTNSSFFFHVIFFLFFFDWLIWTQRSRGRCLSFHIPRRNTLKSVEFASSFYSEGFSMNPIHAVFYPGMDLSITGGPTHY